MSRERLFVLICVLLALIAWPRHAQAHKESDAYLTLRTDPKQPMVLHGQFDLALRDIAFVLDIDRNQDSALTWGEVKGARDEIERYASAYRKVAMQADKLK